MKKKYLKIVVMILEILLILIFLNNIAFSAVVTIKDAEKWGGETAGGQNKIAGKTQNVVGVIVQIVERVGYGISIIMLVYVGIKYMSAAPSERAEFKKSATAYIVGAVVLFGATTIIKLIADFAQTNI